MAMRLSVEKTAHPTSSTRGLYGQRSATTRAAARRAAARRREPPSRSPSDELITLTPHRLNQVKAQLGAQPPDAYVHDVRAGVEIVTPDGRQERALGHGFADVFGELAQQQEFEPGQRHRAVADVGHQPSD